MKAKTVDDYQFYWSDNKIDLCVFPPLENIPPAIALPLSVKKWDLARKADNPADIRTNGVETCGLCELYWGKSCQGCIVKEVTSLVLCMGTPFQAAFRGGISDRQKSVLFEAEYQFLLALQQGGVEAGKAWLAEWRESLEIIGADKKQAEESAT